ncbi:MAG TPA: hypothetical protein VFL53_12615 [Pseudolabrys sp.]|nr:hypothetical protein [Pseudolabrys sp.]
MKEIRKEKQDKFELDALLHPASAFAHPMDVVRDPDLTLSEKRAILASWASDACAVEAAPDLRVSTSGNVVRWDDIMDALRTLDENGGKPLPHYKRVLTKKEAGLLGIRRFRRRGRNDEGAPLN